MGASSVVAATGYRGFTYVGRSLDLHQIVPSDVSGKSSGKILAVDSTCFIVVMTLGISVSTIVCCPVVKLRNGSIVLQRRGIPLCLEWGAGCKSPIKHSCSVFCVKPKVGSGVD